MKKQTLIIIFVFFICAITFAQEEEKKEDLVEKKWEFVASGVLDYATESEDFNPALELHLTYWTNEEWGFGAGYTVTFLGDREVNNVLIPLLSYKPTELITLNIGPSFRLAHGVEDFEVSGYLESEFNFKVGDLQLGPLLGMNVGNEFSLFAGIHTGIEF